MVRRKRVSRDYYHIARFLVLDRRSKGKGGGKKGKGKGKGKSGKSKGNGQTKDNTAFLGEAKTTVTTILDGSRGHCGS